MKEVAKTLKKNIFNNFFNTNKSKVLHPKVNIP